MNNNDYKIKKQDNSTWLVVDINNNVVETVTKEMIIERCKLEDINIDTICADDFISLVWDYFCCLNGKLLQAINIYYDECDQFFAWFDNICIEYMTTKIFSWYFQRYEQTNNIKA